MADAGELEHAHAPPRAAAAADASTLEDTLDDAQDDDAYGHPLLVHAGLFALTAATMLWWWSPDWTGGLYYTAGLLGILFAHEMGHYVAARHYGVAVTLPYFLPGLPPFFTFGAFIRMQTTRLSREALLVIGAAGPLAGAVVALPLYLQGLAMSEVVAMPALVEPGTVLIFGDGLLGHVLIRLFFGPLDAGQDVALHPLAYASWVGFFVTALNLVPIGQLDGGHIGHALFGPRYRVVARVLFVALVLCGAALHPVWLVLGVFLVFTGVEHPPITTPEPPPAWCRAIGYTCFVLFILSFVPTPIHITPLWEMIADLSHAAH